jgi:ribonuclease BN (tRNA processing enzyme)/energy-coupling factor transporter ATP-binding protein EcfA2
MDDAALALAAEDDDALDVLARRVLEHDARVLLLGPPGAGKSTLTRRLGGALDAAGVQPLCVGADPGLPGFGVPGAVCRGRWQDGDWALDGIEPLCTLDAGRFRLPVAAAVRRLVAGRAGAPLLLDGPGVVRGVAGAELLRALVEAAEITVVLALARVNAPAPLADELAILGCRTYRLLAARAARRPGKNARARQRTLMWEAYLEGASTHSMSIDALPLLGTPPPREAAAQWQGRQGALLDSRGVSIAFGEVEALCEDRLLLRCHAPAGRPHALLVRDARRERNGLLGSAGADAVAAVRYVVPADVLRDAGSASGPVPVVRAGPVTAVLVNGVLGDPLLHVRLHHHRRSLLFDLGEGHRLPARVLHQVSDLFLSHAHADHIAGFLWLVRSRIGELPPMRVFGPPGIAANIQGLLDGFHWDRVETRGPRFEVGEFDGERLRRVHLQAGAATRELRPATIPDGVLVEDPELRVRSVVLDHGTPVLAFAIETAHTLNVRKERLLEDGLVPGPWLTQLKSLVVRDELTAAVTLPDGRQSTSGELAGRLLLRSPGVKLAYATDLADTAANREALSQLARGAHTLFCEASFRLADATQAARTGHLTTRACGEIAAEAGVARLVPFHFSRRYEDELAPVYDEIRAVFSRTITPPLRDSGE